MRLPSDGRRGGYSGWYRSGRRGILGIIESALRKARRNMLSTKLAFL